MQSPQLLAMGFKALDQKKFSCFFGYAAFLFTCIIVLIRLVINFPNHVLTKIHLRIPCLIKNTVKHSLTQNFKNILIILISGCTVVGWLALSPHSKRVPGLIPGWEFLAAGYSSFLPLFKNMHFRLIGDSKLSLGVSVAL